MQSIIRRNRFKDDPVLAATENQISNRAEEYRNRDKRR